MQHFVTFILALVRLTNGNGTSNGILEILFQREWYTTCSPSYYYYNNRYNHGDIVCKELGYNGGVVVSNSIRQLTSERMYRYQLWYYYYLECDGTEDSIYDCDNRYGEFYYSYCYYVAEYSCQSMLLWILKIDIQSKNLSMQKCTMQ